MSGYLQRLALTARNSSSSIRPAPESLYSSPKTESPPPIVEEETILSQAVPAAVEPTAKYTPLIDEPVDGSVPTVHRNAQSRPLQPSSVHRAAEPGVRDRLSIPRLARGLRWQPPQTESITSQVEPLVGEPTSVAPARTAPILPVASPLVAPPSATRNSLSPRFTAPSERPSKEVPDEIQIHIGRIEVTAVPPAAPRPAPPKPRKSLDLGEYLKRGLGSGR